MKITLLNHTPLCVASNAIRTCYQSFGKSDSTEKGIGEKDKELIYKVGNKFKHSSTLEHLNYTFYIDGISRAVLQELARHRHANLSVKSTRYTLSELAREKPFDKNDILRAEKYIVFTGNHRVDTQSIKALENLRELKACKVDNDYAKYAIPECYKTSLTWTINARSLQNFLNLRTSSSALWEIRILAHHIFKVLPQEHIYLFEEFLEKHD